MKKMYSIFLSVLLLLLLTTQSSQADKFGVAGQNDYAQLPVTVVPNVNTGTAAGGAFLGPFSNAQRTYQMLINANQLTGLVGQNLSALTFRLGPAAGSNWPAANTTYANFDIYLAPSVPPSNRSLTFDSNIVGTKVLVRSGPITFTAGSFTTGSNPNAFGTDITFDTPYLYTGGHMLIEMRHSVSDGGSTSLEATTTTTGGYGTDFSACWQSSYTATTGLQGNFCTVRLTHDIAGTCTYSWSLNTSGTTNGLNTVKAVDGSTAWAGGANATVRKTTNGGATWVDANPNPGVISGTVYAIESFGTDTAWCTTSPGATFIYRTTNGGTNWTQVHTQAGGFWNVIKFKNNSTGFIQGDPVGGRWSLWRTTDAGTTWDSAGMYLPQAGSEAGWNNSASLIGDKIWFGTNNTKVYYSTNFGTSWTSSPTTGSLNGYSMHFNSPTVGLVGGTAIVKTTDGGVTYGAPITVPGAGNILGVIGKGSDFWCGRGTSIYRSTDAGATWVLDHTAAGTVQAMDFVDDGSCGRGWAVGTGGSIAMIDGIITGLGNGNTQELPSSFKLNQNYPNPFNPSTTISFEVPKADVIELKVYDMLGKEVATLVSGFRQAGTYRVDFNASGLSSGVYVYRMKVGDFVETRKMTLLK